MTTIHVDEVHALRAETSRLVVLLPAFPITKKSGSPDATLVALLLTICKRIDRIEDVLTGGGR